MHNTKEGSFFHRNLKTSNIVLATDFTPKLINCFNSLSTADHKLHKKADVYTCPEYLKNPKLSFDQKSDIYSLGKIFYDLLYGLSNERASYYYSAGNTSYSLRANRVKESYDLANINRQLEYDKERERTKTKLAKKRQQTRRLQHEDPDDLKVVDFSEFESTKFEKMKQHGLLEARAESNNKDAKEKSKFLLQKRLEEKRGGDKAGDDSLFEKNPDKSGRDHLLDDEYMKRKTETSTSTQNGSKSRFKPDANSNSSSNATYHDTWSSVKVAGKFSAVVDKSIDDRTRRYAKAIDVLRDLQHLMNTRYEPTEEEDELIDEYDESMQKLRDLEGSTDSDSAESDLSDAVSSTSSYDMI